MLLAAAVLACLSVVAVVAYAAGADRRAVEGKKGTWVLLATGTIPSGTTGAQIRSRRLVRQVLMPAETVPSGALPKLDASLDARKLNADLQPDQMLLSRQFTSGSGKTAARPTPTFAVPRSRLAVSVELGIAPQVAGNVKRGDRVTVFVTVPKNETEENPQKTRVLLPTVSVISVGESLPPNVRLHLAPSGGASDAPSVSPSPTASDETVTTERYVVTLAVTPSQAEELVNGYNRGRLHLGLLGPGTKVTATPTIIESGPAA
jgi:pilus assembly protein CpaB